jgi:SHS2 domain-containing protein
VEHLLYDFLSEIIFIKDTKGFLASKIKATVKKTGDSFSLTSVLMGENIDRKRHDLRNDLKAITMHMFEIKQEGRKWKARIVVDI